MVITDIDTLSELREDELDQIIHKMVLHSGTPEEARLLEIVTSKLRGIDDAHQIRSIKIREVILALAGKLCRCIGKVGKGAVAPVAVCTKSIFNSRGLQGPGSQFQCTPPLLKPIQRGSKTVIRRSIHS